MKKIYADIVGWYGVGAILAAYTLATFGILLFGGLWYQLLNLTGSLGIVIVAMTKKDRQPAVLNIVWAAIALIALLRLL